MYPVCCSDYCLKLQCNIIVMDLVCVHGYCVYVLTCNTVCELFNV